MGFRFLRICPLIPLLLSFSGAARAICIHIAPDGLGDYANIQAGIYAASYGDTVLLAAGTYTGEGNYNIFFEGRAITVTSESGPVETIVDCQGLGCGFLFNADETNSSILSGLTIRNGDFGNGGAISCWYSSPVISNNIISGNSGTLGGGICIDGIEDTRPIISDNVIMGNSAASGGGIYCVGAAPVISGNTIDENSASGGGGIHLAGTNARIENTIIAFSAQGPGIFCESGNPSVVNCDIFGNEGGDALCGADGGGNISADPLYCGIPGSGNYLLRSISPCAPGNHPSGTLIGARPVGCSDTATQNETWGGIKSRFK